MGNTNNSGNASGIFATTTEDRDVVEGKWRQSMEKLERERLMAEQACKEKRDVVLTMFLNKLINENNP
ncbi:hypothetical protein ACSBR1_029577 [Camellia fascicularis]